MSTDDKDGGPPMLICLPWEQRPRIPGLPEHIKRQCAVCRGFICINPITFTESGIPTDIIPVCGACALDLMDADGGPDNHQFQLTEAQKEGRGSALVRAAIAAAKSADWPKEAVARLREQREYYDASKSAPDNGAEEVN